MLRILTLILLWTNLIAISAFLCWYFFGEGYLGYGYGELVYVAIIVACYVAVCLLLFFSRRLSQSLLGVLIGLIVFDLWFTALLTGYYEP